MVLRAIYVPFTFDESATFFHFVHKGKFWYFNSLPDANNHLVNSLLTWVSYSVFGSSKIALRLPNLLSLPIYLYFVFRISLFLKNDLIRWIWQIVFLSIHFFLEFFALSRGYGLSMAFLMGALHYSLVFVRDGSTSQLIYISIWLFLMQFSNQSTLVLIIAIVLYQILTIYNNNISTNINKRQFLLILVLQVVPLAFSSYYMFYMSNNGSLYYGDNSGFWNLTVQSLIQLVSGKKMHIYSAITGAYILLLLLGLAGIVKKDGLSTLKEPSLLMPIILILTVIGVVLLSELFKINDPEDRVAMYFVPLFVGSVLMLMDYLYSRANLLIFPALVIPLLFFTIHFFYNINLNYVNGYKSEVLPERYYNIIDNDDLSTREFPPTIGGYRMRMFCWQYLNFQNGGKHNLIDYKSYPDTLSDFQIIDLEEFPQWLDYYEIIGDEPVLSRKLLKRKKPVKRRFLDSEVISESLNTSKEFTNLASWGLDDLGNNSFYITFDLNLHSEKMPPNLWVVLQVRGYDNSNLVYKSFPLSWLRTEWNINNNDFKHSVYTGNLPEGSTIKVYIWNVDKEPFNLEKSIINIYSLSNSG